MIVNGLVHDTKSLDLILKQRRTIKMFSVEELFHSWISATSVWHRLEGKISEVARQTLEVPNHHQSLLPSYQNLIL